MSLFNRVPNNGPRVEAASTPPRGQLSTRLNDDDCEAAHIAKRRRWLTHAGDDTDNAPVSRTRSKPIDMDKANDPTNKKTLDPSAWVDEHGDYLFRYAVSRLRNGETAEEVVQQTFLAALQHAGQYAGKGTERGWLLGILKRKIVDFVRQRNRTTSLDGDEGADPSEAMFDQKGSWKPEVRSALRRSLDSLEREEFWQILRGCLKALPARQADVFVLREVDDRTTDEICKDLEITASNVWVLLYRARLQLSKCMKSRWDQESS